MAVMQSVLDVIRAVIAERATGWSRLRDAGIQAASDRRKDESIKDAAARILADYAGEFTSETANERAQFRAAVLLGLAGSDMVEVKPASSKAPSVNKPANMVQSWNEAQRAAACIREDNDMASSGRKGTGARTPAAATNSGAAPIPAGSIFPGVTTATPAPAAPVALGERWDDFGADVKAALADVTLQKRLFAILAQSGYTVKPAKAAAKVDAKIAKAIAAQPVPPAGPMAEALIKAANPAARLN